MTSPSPAIRFEFPGLICLDLRDGSDTFTALVTPADVGAALGAYRKVRRAAWAARLAQAKDLEALADQQQPE